MLYFCIKFPLNIIFHYYCYIFSIVFLIRCVILSCIIFSTDCHICEKTNFPPEINRVKIKHRYEPKWNVVRGLEMVYSCTVIKLKILARIRDVGKICATLSKNLVLLHKIISASEAYLLFKRKINTYIDISAEQIIENVPWGCDGSDHLYGLSWYKCQICRDWKCLET